MAGRLLGGQCRVFLHCSYHTGSLECVQAVVDVHRVLLAVWNSMTSCAAGNKGLQSLLWTCGIVSRKPLILLVLPQIFTHVVSALANNIIRLRLLTSLSVITSG